VLRQLNGAFAVYNDALREAQTGTEVNCSCGSNLYLSNHATSSPPPSATESASRSSSSRRTRCLTNTSTSYPRPSRSLGSSSTSDGWAPRRYAFGSSSLSPPFFETCFFFPSFPAF
jgi:hypothetical protein